MQYQVGSIGRVVLARFNDGDDILAGLQEVARRENIRAAAFHLVGGIRGGRYVVGPETEEMPPVPIWRELTESHEVVGFGTIFWLENAPKVHFHGAYAKRDTVRGGCLREHSETFLVLEAVIQELVGIEAVRAVDPDSGMALLELVGGKAL